MGPKYLHLCWIKAFVWTEALLFFFFFKNLGNKKKKRKKENSFWSSKRPPILAVLFHQCRTGDERARWKLLKLSKKYTVEEKANTYIQISLFLFSPCTLCSLNFQMNRESFVLNKLFWDTLTKQDGTYLFHDPEWGKKICLQQCLCC